MVLFLVLGTWTNVLHVYVTRDWPYQSFSVCLSVCLPSVTRLSCE